MKDHRYRNCRDCRKEWNVSKKERSEKSYIFPHCEYKKRRLGWLSEAAKGRNQECVTIIPKKGG